MSKETAINKIYFIHIRKTAGTSLRSCIANEFPREKICPFYSEFSLRRNIPLGERVNHVKKYDFISGHFYSLGTPLRDDFFIFTILRNPLDRALSVFNHMKNDKRDPYHEAIANLSLIESFDNEIFKDELWNGQTRQLVANAGYDFNSLNSEDSLEVAKDYIQKIDFFGIHELLQDSGLRLSQKMGFDTLKNIPWRNREITSNGLKKNELSETEIAIIKNYNFIDEQLYHFAMNLFNDKVA
ncbi:MAG: sulfotransferase family 2 domain-containing protein [Gammaproteobacteria bacterium]